MSTPDLAHWVIEITSLNETRRISENPRNKCFEGFQGMQKIEKGEQERFCLQIFLKYPRIVDLCCSYYSHFSSALECTNKANICTKLYYITFIASEQSNQQNRTVSAINTHPDTRLAI